MATLALLAVGFWAAFFIHAILWGQGRGGLEFDVYNLLSEQVWMGNGPADKDAIEHNQKLKRRLEAMTLGDLNALANRLQKLPHHSYASKWGTTFDEESTFPYC